MTDYNARDLLLEAAEHADAAAAMLCKLVDLQPQSADDLSAVEYGLGFVRAHVAVSHAYSQASRAGSSFDRTAAKARAFKVDVDASDDEGIDDVSGGRA